MKFTKREYNLYIEGFSWTKRKNNYIEGLYGDLCEVCWKNEGEDVHHQNYKSMDFDNPGTELDEDLLYVCKECHENIHTLAKDKHSTKQEDMDEGLKKLQKFHESYIKNIEEENKKVADKRKKEEKLLEKRKKGEKEKVNEEKINKKNKIY